MPGDYPLNLLLLLRGHLTARRLKQQWACNERATNNLANALLMLQKTNMFIYTNTCRCNQLNKNLQNKFKKSYSSANRVF